LAVSAAGEAGAAGAEAVAAVVLEAEVVEAAGAVVEAELEAELVLDGCQA
jgi:hypothetical protein